jgi:hypothetical protein
VPDVRRPRRLRAVLIGLGARRGASSTLGPAEIVARDEGVIVDPRPAPDAPRRALRAHDVEIALRFPHPRISSSRRSDWKAPATALKPTSRDVATGAHRYPSTSCARECPGGPEAASRRAFSPSTKRGPRIEGSWSRATADLPAAPPRLRSTPDARSKHFQDGEVVESSHPPTKDLFRYLKAMRRYEAEAAPQEP